MPFYLSSDEVDTEALPALFIGASGKLTRGYVRIPLSVLAKGMSALLLKADGSGGSAIQHDEEGAFRWITVHPHGDGEKGTPVKIRESKTHPGTWHVVGGAGGRLNYLRLTRIASPEEAKRKADERKKEREKAKKAKLGEKQRELEGMSDAAREQRDQQEKAKGEAKARLEKEQRQQRRDMAMRVLERAGVDPALYNFDVARARLEAQGLEPKQIDRLELAHEKRLEGFVKRHIGDIRKRLVLDAEARTAAGLGDIPLSADSDDVVTVADLDPDKPGRGLGYQPNTRERSDEAIVRQLAQRDVVRLKNELEDAEQVLDTSTPVDSARLEYLREELRAATLMRDFAGMSTSEIEVAQTDLWSRGEEVEANIHDYFGEYSALADLWKNGKLPVDKQARFEELKSRLTEDQRLASALKRRASELDILLGNADATVAAEARVTKETRRDEVEKKLAEEKGWEAVEARRRFIEQSQAALADHRAMVKALKATGTLPDVGMIDADLGAMSPADMAATLVEWKKYSRFQREANQARESDEAIDDRLFGKAAMLATADIDEAAEEVRAAVQNELAEKVTRSFLQEVEGGEATSLLALSETENRESLERHLSAGSFNAMNNAGLILMGGPAVARDACDVLGASGAAKVLARAVMKSHSESEARAIADVLGEWHLKNHQEAAGAAVEVAKGEYEAAKQIELEAAENPRELRVQQELNAKRRAHLLKAREILGRTLGELEAYAALESAMRDGRPAESLDVVMGPVAVDQAIRQLRALGLDGGDYKIDTDGTNTFVAITGAGMDKLVAPVDKAELRAIEEMRAIKAGERDEPNYVPPGCLSRPASLFNSTASKPEPIARDLKPYDQFGGGKGGLQGDIHDHLGARIADGESPGDVVADIVSGVSSEHRSEAVRILNELMPEVPATDGSGRPMYLKEPERDADGNVVYEAATGADGKPVQRPKMVAKRGADGKPMQAMVRKPAEFYRDNFERLAADFVAKKYPDRPDVQSFHTQSLRVDDPKDRKKTAEAMYVALADDPRRIAAFKEPGELTPALQRALRSYFQTAIKAPGAESGFARKAIERHVSTMLEDEPPKFEATADQLGAAAAGTQGAFFGAPAAASGEQKPSEAWLAWSAKKRKLEAEAGEYFDSSWANFVGKMGGPQRAFAAVQDVMRGDFLRKFAASYEATHGTPLRGGMRKVAHAERFGGFLDPKVRAQTEARQRALREANQRRLSKGQVGGGQFAGVLGALELEQEAAQRQAESQISLFGAPSAAKPASSAMPAGTERFTLGRVAEGQVASLIANVARNFESQPDQPIDMFPGFVMSGKTKIKGIEVDLAPQQRAVKAFLARKRLGAFMGAGSGKTAVAIGGFTAAASDPSTGVKRGLFVVRSNNLGQFHGEFGRFVDPERFRWSADPGASHEERMRAHADGDTHMVTVTHEGFRDDMVKLLSRHMGKPEGDVSAEFMALSRQERAKAMREAWGKAGIDYQASFIDEGHVTLDRRGKADSLLSAVMQAVTDNTPYYMALTADPVKNDVSEIRSQLDKMHTDGRYSDEEAWHQRYGLATSASRDALRREVEGNFFVSDVDPGVERRKRQEKVALSPWQREQYDKVMSLTDKVRADYAGGTVNVAALKELSPQSFQGANGDDGEMQVARGLVKAIASTRDAALHRVINMAPPEHSAKLAKIRDILKADPPKDKPVVIFAHNPSVCESIAEQLRADGHRAITFHGQHSTAEKDQRRMQFQPPKGREPEADVIVLSDAGQTGLNLQRAQKVIQYDIPLTAMAHNQRGARVFRLGQKQTVDAIDLASDTPYERAALKRVERKYDLKDIFGTDAADAFDDGDLGRMVASRLAAMRDEQLEHREAA